MKLKQWFTLYKTDPETADDLTPESSLDWLLQQVTR